MTDEDLKKIKALFEGLVKPFRDEIALVNKNIKDQLHLIHPRIDMIGSRQEMTNDKLDHLSDKVDALSGDIEQLHLDVKGIRDNEGMVHSINKREIDEIKKHLNLPVIPERPKI